MPPRRKQTRALPADKQHLQQLIDRLLNGSFFIAGTKAGLQSMAPKSRWSETQWRPHDARAAAVLAAQRRPGQPLCHGNSRVAIYGSSYARELRNALLHLHRTDGSGQRQHMPWAVSRDDVNVPSHMLPPGGTECLADPLPRKDPKHCIKLGANALRKSCRYPANVGLDISRCGAPAFRWSGHITGRPRDAAALSAGSNATSHTAKRALAALARCTLTLPGQTKGATTLSVLATTAAERQQPAGDMPASFYAAGWSSHAWRWLLGDERELTGPVVTLGSSAPSGSKTTKKKKEEKSASPRARSLLRQWRRQLDQLRTAPPCKAKPPARARERQQHARKEIGDGKHGRRKRKEKLKAGVKNVTDDEVGTHELLFAFKSYVNTPEADRRAAELLREFDPNLLVLESYVWGFRAERFGGNMTGDEEWRALLELLDSALRPQTKIVHIINTWQLQGARSRSSRTLLRALARLPKEKRQRHLVLDTGEVLRKTPRRWVSEHGYRGPPAQLWGRVLAALVCGRDD